MAYPDRLAGGPAYDNPVASGMNEIRVTRAVQQLIEQARDVCMALAKCEAQTSGVKARLLGPSEMEKGGSNEKMPAPVSELMELRELLASARMWTAKLAAHVSELERI